MACTILLSKSNNTPPFYTDTTKFLAVPEHLMEYELLELNDSHVTTLKMLIKDAGIHY